MTSRKMRDLRCSDVSNDSLAFREAQLTHILLSVHSSPSSPIHP